MLIGGNAEYKHNYTLSGIKKSVIPQSRVNRLRNVSCELAYAESPISTQGRFRIYRLTRLVPAPVRFVSRNDGKRGKLCRNALLVHQPIRYFQQPAFYQPNVFNLLAVINKRTVDKYFPFAR